LSSQLKPCLGRHYVSASSSSFVNSLSKTTTTSIMKPATLRPFLPRPAIRRRICITRSYAIQSPGNPTLQIFNRHTKYLQKERAARNVERSRQVDYLKDEVAMRLSERLLVSFDDSIGLQLLTRSGYQSTFQPRPRHRCEFM
jgi:hypothetical protein